MKKKDDRGNLYCGELSKNDELYLDNLCKSIDKKYYKNIEKHINFKFTKDLMNFYEYFNGCRVFYSAITIFGVKYKKSNPYEFVLNNINKKAELEKNGRDAKNVIFIGNIGRYLIWYNSADLKNIKYNLSEDGSDVVLKSFNSIEEIIKVYYEKINKLYNDKGENINAESGWEKANYKFQYHRFKNDIDWEF